VIRWLYDLLYGSSPAEFKNASGLREPVDRFRAVTRVLADHG
jgi:hypothetical protein